MIEEILKALRGIWNIGTQNKETLNKIEKEVNTMVQAITDIQTALTKLEMDVAALEGKVLSSEDVTALTDIQTRIVALDSKVTAT